jgi:predicted phosphodiesterase
VERLASLEPSPTVVAGNHDLMAVGRLPTLGLGPLQRETLEWTWGVLERRPRLYLEALPLSAATADHVVLAHGSLDDPTEYVFDPSAGGEQIRRLGEHDPNARVLVLGHTHLPLACTAGRGLAAEGELELDATGGPWLLNPGSVGQSRERLPLARALVLDLARGVARFLALEYDVRATKSELRALGLPEHACHLAPGRRARLRRRLATRG